MKNGRACIVELIDDFFAEYPVATGEPNPIDTDEAIVAVAKTVAELTSSKVGAVRQKIIEQLMHEIMNYDAEFREQEAIGTDRSHARHYPTETSLAMVDYLKRIQEK
jgi:hypothetical protein